MIVDTIKFDGHGRRPNFTVTRENSQQKDIFGYACTLLGETNKKIIRIIINDNVYDAVLMTMVTARRQPVHLMNAD